MEILQQRAGPFHETALLEEAMSYLISGPGLYLDGTVGGGGHAAALLDRCESCRLLAVDRDPRALREASRRLRGHAGRFRTALRCFSDAPLDAEVVQSGLSGAILDLGVSSRQLDSDARGFTFRRSAPLDMRMDQGSGESASEFLNRAPEREIVQALADGDAPRPWAVAKRIVRRRARQRLAQSDEIVGALQGALGRPPKASEKARLFQAIRMRVNDEARALKLGLSRIRDALLVGARLVVISYHSIEDRIVKHAFRRWSDPASALPPGLPAPNPGPRSLGETLTRKPVRPEPAEISRNPRARSARLRAWVRSKET